MSTYEKRMIQYEGDFMENEIFPVLEEGFDRWFSLPMMNPVLDQMMEEAIAG